MAHKKPKKRKIIGKKDILPAGSLYKPKTIAEAKKLGWKPSRTLMSNPPKHVFTKEGQTITITGKKQAAKMELFKKGSKVKKMRTYKKGGKA